MLAEGSYKRGGREDDASTPPPFIGQGEAVYNRAELF
jgi:hypothetical protein